MSFRDPQGELLPPAGATVPAAAVPVADAPYAPAQSPAEQASKAAARSGRSTFHPTASPATYLLLAINCVVFLWMVLHGASATDPTRRLLLHYGANSTTLVLTGQWYRLLTATFVHIGLIHLAGNMWCLWNLGLLGEPLIGAYGLVAVYMLTGIAGNLLSMGINVWQQQDSVGAGASGAVFGIAGILIVLLSNQRLPVPWEELKRLRRSVIQFAVLNLILGGATIFMNTIRIDNSAHIGGFLCGLLLGVPMVPRMTAGRVRYLARQKATFLTAAFVLALLGYAISKWR